MRNHSSKSPINKKEFILQSLASHGACKSKWYTVPDIKICFLSRELEFHWGFPSMPWAYFHGQFHVLIHRLSKLFYLSDRRPDITKGLRKLQCRSLIFVGENSPFHSEALHMTSKLDRRFSALVEVFQTGVPFIMLCLLLRYWKVIGWYVMPVLLFMKCRCCYSGSSMWFNGDWRAARCNVDSTGILSHGIWLLSAV